MKKLHKTLTITSLNQLNNRYYMMKLRSSDTMPPMRAGMFVQIRVPNAPNTFLRRPISIHNVDYNTNEFWLLIQSVGEGTTILNHLPIGTSLDVLYPLGNGFSLPRRGTEFNALLVGGGVGIAPLFLLGKELKELGFFPKFLLGFRKKEDIILLEEFKSMGDVYITTEDGSYGEKGFVTHHSILKEDFTIIYTCGPKLMMQSVARHAKKRGISCEVSLENLMACGFGVCLCCVEPTLQGNRCVCTEGPVFNIKELLWQI